MPGTNPEDQMPADVGNDEGQHASQTARPLVGTAGANMGHSSERNRVGWRGPSLAEGRFGPGR